MVDAAEVRPMANGDRLSNGAIDVYIILAAGAAYEEIVVRRVMIPTPYAR